MFYNFEEEEKEKVLHKYSLGDLSSLSKEELLSVGAVNFFGYLHDEEAGHNFAKYLSRLKEKTSNLENITILESTESIFTPEVVLQLAECFPYVKTFRICGWGYSTFSPGGNKKISIFQKFADIENS